MNKRTLIGLAVLAMLLAVVVRRPGSRAAQLVSEPLPRTSSAFVQAQSVALFVGVRTFSADSGLEVVPYAVDDAVDLAYTFALDPRVSLVPPARVALALSDDAPQKPDSRWRLEQLRRAGATISSARRSDIVRLLEQQSRAAGRDGIFIVSFATHGFSIHGSQHVLAADSLFREPQTAISAAQVSDRIASRAARSLLLVDACRERVIRGVRAGTPEPLSAAPLLKAMAQTQGQVILSAAAGGNYAYDDHDRKNGVFTAAVLDGLQCRAGNDRGGLVTIDTLSTYVEESVRAWIRRHRDRSIRNATQVSMDGATRSMPLAVCSGEPPPDPPPPPVDPPPVRAALRPRLERCRADGQALTTLYGSTEPDRFVAAYLGWRDGCAAVLRDLDERLPKRKGGERETSRFLAKAELWSAAACPKTLSEGRCGLFGETSHAERCSWDLYEALLEVDNILIRNPES